MSVDIVSLQIERNHLRRELDRIRDLTGQVKHTNPDECYECGCYSMTAEEAVVYALRELRAELAEQKAANIALAERLAACSEVLGKAAERGKVCGCQEKDKTSFGLPGAE